MSADSLQMLIHTLSLLEQEPEPQEEPIVVENTNSDDKDYLGKIEEFLFNLGPDDVGVEKFGPYIVHFEGFSDYCQQDAQDRCHLPKEDPRHLANYDDIYDEVLRDFINRENGNMPIESGLTGDEEYPIYYAIFKEEGRLTEDKSINTVAYHGSTDDIAEFRPFSHFGSETAAKDRMDYKKVKNGKVYKVELNINNPLEIKDFPGTHYDRFYAFTLRDKKLISQEEMEYITTEQNPQELRKRLLSKLSDLGIDGFVYKNRYEDKGNLSYVIVDPRQAKIVDVEEVALAEEIIDEYINKDTINPDFTVEKEIQNGYILKANGLESGKGIDIKVYDPKSVFSNSPIGNATFKLNNDDKTLTSSLTTVHHKYQKQGIARAMYQFVHDLGNDIQASKVLLPGGQRMWDAFKSQGTTFSNEPEPKPEVKPEVKKSFWQRLFKEADTIDNKIIDEASPNTLEGSFTPDLVESKKWLAEMLAKGLKGKNAGTIYVLGSWYGNMGIFLKEAGIKFDKIVLVEPNEEYLRQSKKLLDKVNSDGKIVFLNQKAEDVVYEKPGVVINTSCNETGPVFLNKVPDNMLCLLQARNNNESTLFPTEAMEDFVDYFPLSKVYYTGDKYLEDPEINYMRYMKIGRK